MFEAFNWIGLLEKNHVYKYKVWKIKKNISFYTAALYRKTIFIFLLFLTVIYAMFQYYLFS
jgi:hypothetical protein